MVQQAQISDSYLKAPRLAWPTLVLFLLTVVASISGIVLVARGHHPALGFALGFLASFVTFTTLHEATHQSLSRNPVINGIVGHLGALIMFAPWAPFRHLHLVHHAHTNDLVKDPDIYCGSGPKRLLPLRWASQDLYYILAYLRLWRKRSRSDQLSFIGSVAAMAGGMAILISSGLVAPMLWAWILPARVATFCLVWSFDFLPHHPRLISADENRFAASHVVHGTWLTLPMLYQNYHLIHHLYPAVPFYRYARIWRAQRETLIERGARQIRLFWFLPGEQIT